MKRILLHFFCVLFLLGCKDTQKRNSPKPVVQKENKIVKPKKQKSTSEKKEVVTQKIKPLSFEDSVSLLYKWTDSFYKKNAFIDEKNDFIWAQRVLEENGDTIRPINELYVRSDSALGPETYFLSFIEGQELHNEKVSYLFMTLYLTKNKYKIESILKKDTNTSEFAFHLDSTEIIKLFFKTLKQK